MALIQSAPLAGKTSYDSELTARLWEVSADLVALTADAPR
jgi:hypothetical protein